MQDTQRIEVVIDSIHVNQVVELFRNAGVAGYTVIRNASGWGDRGARVPDGVSGVFENCVVLCACDQDRWDAVAEDLRGLLKRYGGVALVSQAQLMRH